MEVCFLSLNRNGNHGKSVQKVQVIPLGGLGEIGKNMTAIRVDDEILVVDSGLMFRRKICSALILLFRISLI